MPAKTLPFTKVQLEKIIQDFPTPFHIYDEKAIRENARYFLNSFSWNKGFKEYYAIKAAPNPYLMKILAGRRFWDRLQFNCRAGTGKTGRNERAGNYSYFE